MRDKRFPFPPSESASSKPRRRGPKTALLLMPGGAKGAYQAGALLRLAEAGVAFDCVIGSSIGALNGAYYVQGDGSRRQMERLCALWCELPVRVSSAIGITTFLRLLDLFRGGTASVSSFMEDILAGRDSLFGSLPLASLLDSVMDYRLILSSRRAFFIGVMEEWGTLFDTLLAPFRKATFIAASALRPEELRRALLASAAIPIVFSSQEVRGTRCRDAGWARFDLTPITVGRRIELIVSVELSRDRIAPVEILASPTPALLRITPSLPIDEGGLLSTFDFSGNTIRRLIELGYRDADRALRSASLPPLPPSPR